MRDIYINICFIQNKTLKTPSWYWVAPHFRPQNRLNSLGHERYTVSKVFHRDTGPCWLQCFSQLCQVGWRSFGWWTLFDTYGKQFSVKNPAALQFLTHSNWCAWHLPPYPVQRHLNLCLAHSPSELHTYNPSINCLKAQKSFFNLSPPLHLYWLKWI